LEHWKCVSEMIMQKKIPKGMLSETNGNHVWSKKFINDMKMCHTIFPLKMSNVFLLWHISINHEIASIKSYSLKASQQYKKMHPNFPKKINFNSMKFSLKQNYLKIQ